MKNKDRRARTQIKLSMTEQVDKKAKYESQKGHNLKVSIKNLQQQKESRSSIYKNIHTRSYIYCLVEKEIATHCHMS